LRQVTISLLGQGACYRTFSRPSARATRSCCVERPTRGGGRRSGLGSDIALLLVTPTVSAIVLDIGYLIEQPDNSRSEYAATRRFEMPVGMLAQNLGIVALIPIS